MIVTRPTSGEEAFGALLVRRIRPSASPRNNVTPEPLKAQSFNSEAWFARLDELGARDFLPDGIAGDPPLEPDSRVFFYE